MRGGWETYRCCRGRRRGRRRVWGMPMGHQRWGSRLLPLCACGGRVWCGVVDEFVLTRGKKRYLSYRSAGSDDDGGAPRLFGNGATAHAAIYTIRPPRSAIARQHYLSLSLSLLLIPLSSNLTTALLHRPNRIQPHLACRKHPPRKHQPRKRPPRKQPNASPLYPTTSLPP